jgi:hypothetical protein
MHLGRSPSRAFVLVFAIKVRLELVRVVRRKQALFVR